MEYLWYTQYVGLEAVRQQYWGLGQAKRRYKCTDTLCLVLQLGEKKSQSQCGTSEEEASYGTTRPLALVNLLGCFALLICGALLGFLVFLLETSRCDSRKLSHGLRTLL